MSALMEMLWKQALKTFAGTGIAGCKPTQNNFDKLYTLMNEITAHDVNLDKKTLDYVKNQSAPLCVIDIYENEDITIAIFILKQGVTMPMHDHPGMHGLLKVLSGVVRVNSYSLKETDNIKLKLKDKIEAIKHHPTQACSSCPAFILTPWEKNLHEITCIEGPAAFLDVLSPPYDEDRSGNGPRPCRCFKEIDMKSNSATTGGIQNVQLMVTENPPDFYSRSIKYSGPLLK